MCLLRLKGGARLIQRLLRINLLVEKALGALIIQAVQLQVGFGFVFLRLRRCQRRLRLFDLVARLRLLIFQRRLGFRNLRSRSPLGVKVIGLVSAQFLGFDHGEQLPGLYRVAFFYQHLGKLPLNLRACHHIVGGDDAGQDQGLGPRDSFVINHSATENEHDQNR